MALLAWKDALSTSETLAQHGVAAMLTVSQYGTDSTLPAQGPTCSFSHASTASACAKALSTPPVDRQTFTPLPAGTDAAFMGRGFK